MTFDKFFIAFGVILQVLIYTFVQDSLLSLISSVCAIIAAVLYIQRKKAFYWFGFTQIVTYIALCWQEKLYGGIIGSISLFIIMLYSLFFLSKDEKEIRVRSLEPGHALVIYFNTLCLGMGTYAILSYTNDPQPLTDALTFVLGALSQVLMVMRFRDSWHYWIIVSVGSMAMWSEVGNWIMFSQFIFCLLSCLYGIYKLK